VVQGIRLHDLLLQSPKRLLALTIEQRHVDIKDAQQAVSRVLEPRGVPLCSPGHPLRDARFGQRGLATEVCDLDPGDPAQAVPVFEPRADTRPIAGKQYHLSRREELLERPAAREPASPAEIKLSLIRVGVDADVGKVGVAHGGPFVVAEHGVDGLGELGAAPFVDAATSQDTQLLCRPINRADFVKHARIDPHPVVSVRFGLEAAIVDLGVALLCLESRLGQARQVLEADLVLGPCVREDRVRLGVGIGPELFGLSRVYIEQFHSVSVSEEL